MTAKYFVKQLKRAYDSELGYSHEIAFEPIPDTAQKSVTFALWNSLPFDIINIPALIEVLVANLDSQLQEHDAWILENKRPKFILAKEGGCYVVTIETFVLYYQLESTVNWLELLGYPDEAMI
jgi:hypothetical protein